MATTKVQVEGLKDLEQALTELPKATSRNVLLRALKKAAQPITDAAQAKAPVETGQLRDSIIVTSRVRNRVGLTEYAQTMASTGDYKEAQSALRTARREGGPGGARAEVNIGPTAPHAHLLEFGTVKMSAHPFMRPAWESEKDGALIDISNELKAEIEKARARLARKAARLAAKG